MMVNTVDLSLLCAAKCSDYMVPVQNQNALLGNTSVKTFTAIKKNVENNERKKLFDRSDEVIHVANLHKLSRLQHNGWNYKNFCKMNDKIKFNKGSCYKKPIVHEEKNLSSIDQAVKVSINNESQSFTTIKRTKDQENAIRRIEDVHNYAKNYDVFAGSSSTESNCSSSHNDDDAEDHNEDETENLRYLRQSNFKNNLYTINKANEEDLHIDVETLSKDDEIFITNDLKEENVPIETDAPPEHHARRPMNAFLIFCKRHRSIVKDRYKSLENRAITKILGDWWASLDTNEKKCFTNLAQQNKDAFFSANPNFKWYKLPAPPLRTLQMRTNLGENESAGSDNQAKEVGQNNYFKLADETQMGDLNTLLVDDKEKSVLEEQFTRQETLGETSQLFNQHLVKTTNIIKRRLKCNNKKDQEQETIQRKTSRLCKGKIYQELVHSGQITAIIKKSKGTLLAKDVKQSLQNDYQQNDSAKIAVPTIFNTTRDQLNEETAMNAVCENSSKIFDLEQKIKELPALNLDAYLQQKKNTKKKRKISVKKKCSLRATGVQILKSNEIKVHNECASNAKTSQDGTAVSVAVGSQKRKARKESITRRDISALDNEVTAVLDIDNKDCSSNSKKYCLYESSLCLFDPASTTNADHNCNTFSKFNNESKLDIYSHDNKAASLTSDLLILAEVAVNRSATPKLIRNYDI